MSSNANQNAPSAPLLDRSDVRVKHETGVSGAVRAFTVIRPRSVNFSALSVRLESIWVSLIGSPITSSGILLFT